MTAPLSEAEIRDALARAERATGGEWSVKREDVGDDVVCIVPIELLAGDVTIVSYEGGFSGRAGPWTIGQLDADAEFIAHARTDVPRLAADLLAAREERDELREWKRTHSMHSTLRTRAERAEARCVEWQKVARKIADFCMPEDWSAWFDTEAQKCANQTGVWPNGKDIPTEAASREERDAAWKRYMDGRRADLRALLSPPTPSPEPEATPVEDACDARHPTDSLVTCVMPRSHVARGQDHVGHGIAWPVEAKCATCKGTGRAWMDIGADIEAAKPCPDCGGCGGAK